MPGDIAAHCNEVITRGLLPIQDHMPVNLSWFYGPWTIAMLRWLLLARSLHIIPDEAGYAFQFPLRACS
jgi:hypothetical protein